MENITTDLIIYFNSFYKDDLTSDDNLFETGALDSTGVMELIMFIQEKFGVTIEVEEVIEENFESIIAVEKMIKAKLI